MITKKNTAVAGGTPPRWSYWCVADLELSTVDETEEKLMYELHRREKKGRIKGKNEYVKNKKQLKKMY